jgi:hypothetical protein
MAAADPKRSRAALVGNKNQGTSFHPNIRIRQEQDSRTADWPRRKTKSISEGNGNGATPAADTKPGLEHRGKRSRQAESEKRKPGAQQIETGLGEICRWTE